MGCQSAQRRTHRQAHALRALHHVPAYSLGASPGFLHDDRRNQGGILRDAVRLTGCADLGHKRNNVSGEIHIFSGAAAPERSGNGGDYQQGHKKKCRQRSPG